MSEPIKADASYFGFVSVGLGSALFSAGMTKPVSLPVAMIGVVLVVVGSIMLSNYLDEKIR